MRGDGGLERRRTRLGFLHLGRDGRVESRIQEGGGRVRRGDGGRKMDERKQYFELKKT